MLFDLRNKFSAEFCYWVGLSFCQPKKKQKDLGEIKSSRLFNAVMKNLRCSKHNFAPFSFTKIG